MVTRKKDKGLAVEGLRIACGLDWRGGLDERGFEREDVPVFAFLSTAELQTLIAARLQAAGHEVEFFEYEKFINL